MVPSECVGFVYSDPLLLREASSATGRKIEREMRGLGTDEVRLVLFAVADM